MEPKRRHPLAWGVALVLLAIPPANGGLLRGPGSAMGLGSIHGQWFGNVCPVEPCRPEPPQVNVAALQSGDVVRQAEVAIGEHFRFDVPPGRYRLRVRAGPLTCTTATEVDEGGMQWLQMSTSFGGNCTER